MVCWARRNDLVSSSLAAGTHVSAGLKCNMQLSVITRKVSCGYWAVADSHVHVGDTHKSLLLRSCFRSGEVVPS